MVNHYTDYNGEIWCLRVDGNENVVTEFQNSKEAKLKSNTGQFAKKGIKNGKYFSYFYIYNEDVVDICDFTLIINMDKQELIKMGESKDKKLPQLPNKYKNNLEIKINNYILEIKKLLILKKIKRQIAKIVRKIKKHKKKKKKIVLLKKIKKKFQKKKSRKRN